MSVPYGINLTHGFAHVFCDRICVENHGARLVSCTDEHLEDGRYRQLVLGRNQEQVSLLLCEPRIVGKGHSPRSPSVLVGVPKNWDRTEDSFVNDLIHWIESNAGRDVVFPYSDD